MKGVMGFLEKAGLVRMDTSHDSVEPPPAPSPATPAEPAATAPPEAAMPVVGTPLKLDEIYAKAGVPALYIKSGSTLRDAPEGAGKALLDDYDAKRYHKPGDEYSGNWDVSGTIEDLRLLFEVGARAANSETWPAWRAGNEFAPAREKSAKSREPAEE